jgi:hypothetical protein
VYDVDAVAHALADEVDSRHWSDIDEVGRDAYLRAARAAVEELVFDEMVAAFQGVQGVRLRGELRGDS